MSGTGFCEAGAKYLDFTNEKMEALRGCEKDEEISFKPAPLPAAELSNLAFVSVPFPKQLDLPASVCNDIRQVAGE